MNIEDEMTQSLAKSIQEQVDYSVMFDVYVKSGWAKVTVGFDHWFSTDDPDIISWVKENCTGKYFQSGADFAFEDEKDATAFALKWS